MNELPLYQIVNWNQFENSRSRTYAKPQFVCVPNKHGGSGLSNVLGEPDGAAVYGVWQLILQVCSRQSVGQHRTTGGGVKVFESDRDGWLTADGKKEGRRLSAREISNMFRRPVEEIHRCLMVISSPEVDFIRLVAGQHEFLPPTLHGHHGISELPPVSPSDTQYQTDTTPAGDRHRGNALDVLERKKEQKEVLSQRPGDPGTSADTPTAGERQETGTAPTPARHQPDTEPSRSSSPPDVVQHAEAKLILGKLCRDLFPDEATRVRAAIWPNDWEHWLDEALPISRDSLELVDWAYRLPDDDRLFEVTMKRHTFGAIIENLPGEVSKIRSARKKLGLNGLTPDGNSRATEDWTPARKKAALELYGAERPLPDRFSQMASSARAEIESKIRDVQPTEGGET